ncbi:MAG: hypothetical protein KTR31_08890, partial [Myxococcales bacterium]|nr:hypothetical protein [Myxococcales bacterium]
VARTAARDWASAPQGASPRAGVLPSAVAAGAHPRAPQPVSLEAPSRAPGEAGSAQARAGSRGRGRAVAHRLLERAGSSRHEAPEASGTVRTAGRGWSQRPALHTVSAPVEGAPVGGTDRTRSGGASEAAPRAATRSRATAPAADSVAPTRSRVRSETVRTAAGERAPTSAQHTPVRARSLSRAVARTWLAEEGSGVQAPATDPGGARSWAGARTLTLPEAGEPAPREQAEAGSSGARRGSARGLRTPRGARALSRAMAARSERMAGARTLRSRGPGPALASLREPGEAASVQAERGVAGVRSVLEAPTAAVDAVASGQSGGRAVAGSPVRTSPRTPRAMPTVSLASDDAQPMPAAARGAARAERTVRAAQRVVTPQRTSLSGEEPSGSASTPGPSQPGATRVVTRSASSTAGIAQKLMRLINLAERERSAAEAEELVRMSEAHSAGQGPGPGESAAEDSSVNIQALHRDVLEAVLRELDNLQWRREDPDGPNFWC